jgi:hypothetical protein
MNICSDFTFPAFGRHVTISFLCDCISFTVSLLHITCILRTFLRNSVVPAKNCKLEFEPWFAEAFRRNYSSIFWDVTTCSPVKFSWRFEGTYRLRLHLHGWKSKQGCDYHLRHVGSCLSYSTLNMESIFSSETSVRFPQTTRRCILEYRTRHSHLCENLESIVLEGFCFAIMKLQTFLRI